jgi:hypothetical protein
MQPDSALRYNRKANARRKRREYWREYCSKNVSGLTERAYLIFSYAVAAGKIIGAATMIRWLTPRDCIVSRFRLLAVNQQESVSGNYRAPPLGPDSKTLSS